MTTITLVYPSILKMTMTERIQLSSDTTLAIAKEKIFNACWAQFQKLYTGYQQHGTSSQLSLQVDGIRLLTDEELRAHLKPNAVFHVYFS